MPRGLSKITGTVQAIAALIENPQNRLEFLRPIFQSAGFKLLEYWYAVDENALYLLTEGPDDPTTQLAMYWASLEAGSVSSFQYTRLLDAEEAMEAMRKAKGFRPPSR